MANPRSPGKIGSRKEEFTMRRTFVFALATLIALPLLAVLAVSLPQAAEAQAKTLDGKQVFLAQKCNICHSVSSAGITATMKSEKMKGPDLTNLAAKQDAKVLNDFLRKKAPINGKKHSKEFTGSDEELGAMIAWLQAQKK
jgi:mono/diheme cytochrome c family protein